MFTVYSKHLVLVVSMEMESMYSKCKMKIKDVFINKDEVGDCKSQFTLKLKNERRFEDLFLFDKSVGSARELHIAIIAIIGTYEDSRSLLDLL